MSFSGFRGSKEEEKSTPASSTSTTTSSTMSPSAPRADAFLGKGSKVVGTLTFSGPVELDGNIEGEVIAQDRLTIGEAAVIHAKVSGAEITVRGTVHGDIIASKRLSLKKPAKIVGNISSASLSIEEGVIFEGKCSMNVPSGTSAGSSADYGKSGSSSKSYSEKHSAEKSLPA